MSHSPVRLALWVVALLPLTACDILVTGAECPDLDELCPDLQCDNYAQNRDGCSICECDGAEQPVTCFSDSECAEGQLCDTVNYCEADPSCLDGADCPAVCLGRCVDAPSTCRSDADCGDNEICVPVGNARPAPEEPAGDQAEPIGCSEDVACGEGFACINGSCASAPDTGVCLPVGCAEEGAAIDLPSCPPGTEPSLDFSVDACGNPICIPVDGCSDLDPQTCRETPGCEVFTQDCCGTENPDCDCAPFERCGPTDDCAGLTPDQCVQNPACELVDAGGSGGAGAQCETCDDNGNCTPCDVPVAPPPEQLCVPRQPGGCFSDAECAPGERCELIQVCATGCETNADTGEETCVDQCWTEQGQCVQAVGSCWDILDPDTCVNTPGCELIGDGTQADPAPPEPCDPDVPDCGGGGALPPPLVCQPSSTSCTDDSQCAEGQHCEVSETCPPCDPSNGDDVGCLAPCYVQGVCVDGTPPPVSCNSDTDCGLGGTCITVEECGGCGVTSDGQERPAPCDPICTSQNVCVQTAALCFNDTECQSDELCDFSQSFCGTPGGLVAQCQGVCIPRDPTPGDGAYCLSADDCGPDQGCINNDAICRDNPNSDLEACWGWCVSACGDALTPAEDPTIGQCVVFPDTCIPPEWTQVDACQ